MNRKQLEKQKEYFDVTANQYDTKLIYHPPYHTKLETDALLKPLEKLSKKDLIVDYGAGSGRITIPLLQKKLSVLAVDISEQSLVKITGIAKKLSLSTLQTSYILPKNRKVQAIVGADILHHLDLDEKLPEMYEALDKDGIVVFSEPCAWNPAWHIYLRIAADWEVEKRMVYCSYFNLKKTFERHGFRDVKIRGLGILPRPFFNWSPKISEMHDALGNVPPFNLFAYRYIIEAKK